MIVPLFPLHATLFPGGHLALKIFEARYMDMASACLKDGSPFGVCLLAQGEEVARPGLPAATPHAIGTLARIDEWDMPQLGVLHITAAGTQRFRIRRSWTDSAALLQGEVELLTAEAAAPVPAQYAALVALLRGIVEEAGALALYPLPHAFDDASWVGMRLAEVLPIPALAKQKLLEVEDALLRLEIVYRFLDGKGLLPDSA